MSEDLGWLPRYGRFRFHFSMPAGASLPQYPGSAWRGVFGWALRELACVTGQPSCRGCLLQARCLYQRLFETAVGHAEKGVSTHAPHPFVLHVPPADHGSYGSRQAVVEMVLLGEALEDLPAVVKAMRRAGESGVAGRRNRLRLWSVSQWHDGRWEPILRPEWQALRQLEPDPAGETPPFPGGSLHVRLYSPLRLKHQGRLVNEHALTPRIFVHALYARMNLLARHHARPVGFHWPDISQQARFSAARLEWIELDRYSSRQGRKLRIGGLLGEFTLDIHELEAVWPLLWHGQFLHVGKLTSMGHGAYRIRLPEPPD